MPRFSHADRSSHVGRASGPADGLGPAPGILTRSSNETNHMEAVIEALRGNKEPLRDVTEKKRAIENRALKDWITQKLGGTWPARDREPNVPLSEAHTIESPGMGMTHGARAPTEKAAKRRSAPAGGINYRADLAGSTPRVRNRRWSCSAASESLAYELLNPEARDALTKLAKFNDPSNPLDSDVVLLALNAKTDSPFIQDLPVEAYLAARSVPSAKEDALVAPLAKERDARTAGESLCVEVCDEELEATGQTFATSTEPSQSCVPELCGCQPHAFDGILPVDADLSARHTEGAPAEQAEQWYRALLSPQARAKLLALEARACSGSEPPPTSDDVLAALNAGCGTPKDVPHLRANLKRARRRLHFNDGEAIEVTDTISPSIPAAFARPFVIWDDLSPIRSSFWNWGVDSGDSELENEYHPPKRQWKDIHPGDSSVNATEKAASASVAKLIDTPRSRAKDGHATCGLGCSPIDTRYADSTHRQL
ncbi:hypothetical protein GGX14DRAFT_667867 [Mycena pura]|uniref:Uncharacterized protein n=1 Tax=Mycena pura TaxID=153505 RepID=A0AAD6V1Q6_9AGAR|nr:hypothetical protein GGX14DRAFT_667867 [Mycena pura]